MSARAVNEDIKTRRQEPPVQGMKYLRGERRPDSQMHFWASDGWSAAVLILLCAEHDITFPVEAGAGVGARSLCER